MPPERSSTFAFARSDELRELEQLVGALGDLPVRHAEVAAVDDEVVADSQLHVEVVLLRDDAELSADLGAALVGIQAEHLEVAAGAGRHGADHPHRGRLARAVGSEQAERFALGDLERDAVDGDELLVLLGEVAKQR